VSNIQKCIIFVGLLLIGASAYLLIISPPFGISIATELPRVPLVGNQFESSIGQVAIEFERAVKAANARVEDLQIAAHTYESWSSAIGWIALFVTSSITILAAFAGVNVNQLPASPQARSRLVIAIAVLGAVSSSLLLVNERLDNSATVTRKIARQLYDQTLNARRAFVGETKPDAAEQIRLALSNALLEAGAIPATK
jgi:hypothetical protein